MGKKDKIDSDGEDESVSPTHIVAEVERLSRLMRQASHAHGLVPVHWESLRYLARANRFSNAPGSLARYLATTKGTISQTIRALEKRGLVQKNQRGSDSRSISLSLTPAANELLKHDPLNAVIADAEKLGGKTTRRFARAISELLDGEIRRKAEPSFGNCLTCAHLIVEEDGLASCKIFNAKIEEQDIDKICHRHES